MHFIISTNHTEYTQWSKVYHSKSVFLSWNNKFSRITKRSNENFLSRALRHSNDSDVRIGKSLKNDVIVIRLIQIRLNNVRSYVGN